MNSFYATQYSVAVLTTLMLNIAIIILLERIPQKSDSIRYLLRYFYTTALFFGVSFIYHSFVADWQVFFGAIQYPLLALTQLPLLQFAYNYTHSSERREYRIAIVVCISMILLITVLAVYYIIGRVSGAANYFLLLPAMSIGIFAISLWICFVVFRTLLLVQNLNENIPLSTPRLLKTLITKEYRIKNIRRLGYLCICLALLCCVVVLRDIGIISPTGATIFHINGSLLFFVAFVIIHLTHSPEVISVVQKILLTVLGIVLMILGSITLVLLTIFSNSLHHINHDRVTMMALALDNSGINSVPDRVFRLALHSRYICTYTAAQPTQRTVLYNADSAYTQFIQTASPEQYVVSTIEPGREQALVYLNPIRSNVCEYIVYRYLHGTRWYEVGFAYTTFRQELHIRSIVFIIAGSILTILMILGLPYLLRSNVLRPLKTLLAGVEQANRGDLQVKVPVFFQDEIGFLADSFNQMIASIETNERERRQILEEQNLHLEQQVQERTRALQDQNRLMVDAHDKIHHQMEELDRQAQEIQRVNDELQQRNELLEKLTEEQQELLGIVAHDLKNPVSNIKVLAQLLHQRYGSSDAEIEEVGGRILKISQRMFHLIQSLLDMNALEQGVFSIKPIVLPLIPLVESIIETHQPQALHKSIQICTIFEQNPIMAYADKRAVGQIVENLVSNAIKYSPPDSAIQIQILEEPLTETQKEYFLQKDLKITTWSCIRVQDEGQGINEDDRKKLFQKFSRLSAMPTGGEYSTGLGLAIVKALLDKHYGSIRFEPNPTGGAIFIVHLPGMPQNLV